MADTRAPAEWPRCKRCGGQMYRGQDGERTCMWCGEVRYPAPAAGPGLAARAYGLPLERQRSRRR